MADVVQSPFKDAIYKTKRGSDFEGKVEAGGDIRVAGNDVVIGGPQIGDEPSDLFDYLKSLP